MTVIHFVFSFGQKNLIGLVFGANVALSAVVKSKYWQSTYAAILEKKCIGIS